MSEEGARATGTWLVLGQFACIAALAWGGSWRLPWWAWSLFLAGVVVMGMAAWALGTHNISAMPEPVPGNTLTKRGIYHTVRHPMYLAVLLCGFALALGAPTGIRWVALGMTIPVLVAKIRHEERRLTARHPDYPELMEGVARLIPGVW